MRWAIASAGILAFTAIAAAVVALGPQRTAPIALAAVREDARAASVRAEYVPFVGAPDHPVRDDPAIVRRPRRAMGLLVPVPGRAVPTTPELLPNAPRAYRAGVHEGIDFPAPTGTPVVAAADGVVVRIDHAYLEPTAVQHRLALDRALSLGYTPEATLDAIRGRQVWIGHGRGVVTRYAHLVSVAPIPLGSTVRAGEVIGAVGSSGLPEGGPHLHFEVRLDDGYLGMDEDGDELSRVVERAFR